MTDVSWQDSLLVHDAVTLQRNARFRWLVESGLVAPSPGVAVARMEQRFGAVPNRFGTNCSGFGNLRETIGPVAADGAGSFTNAIMLVAPHTHWNPAPVIQTLDSDGERYWIGPQDGEAPYSAVSFVFHETGPLPYEWADASCGLKLGDLRTIWHFIHTVNSQAIKADWFIAPFPIGLSINHRFKHPFHPMPFSTMEAPVCEESKLACVVPTPSAEGLAEDSVGQVGWSSAIPPELNDWELWAISELDKRLARLPPSEASRLLNDLVGQ